LTQRCLEEVRSSEADIVVVDDGSTDKTAELLASLEPHVRRVTHSSNQGFSASCNDGATAAVGEYLVFLNNDTLPHPGWLEALVRYADSQPGASVVGARLLYPDNTVQHAGVVICQDRYPRHIYTGFPAEHPAVNRSRQFQIVTGACMLIRRELFMQAGGFDTGFCNGFEDVDLCLRLREAGHQVHYCADAVVQHLESVSPGRFKRDHGNVALYRERWLHRVRPDDLQYYLEDGLMQLSYQGTFPLTIEISPRLAVVDETARGSAVERLLEERAQEIADLRRENTRLILQLQSGEDSGPHFVGYDELRRELREIVHRATPPGSQLLVVSKGDRALLEFTDRQASHFPQSLKGTYSGHHPADSFTAIAHLEALRNRGAEYLIFPSTAFWWLQHYRELGHYLASRCRLVTHEPEVCMVFKLPPSLGPASGLEDNPGISETARLEEAEPNDSRAHNARQ
jgi:GT2 family glycosyltransferase